MFSAALLGALVAMVIWAAILVAAVWLLWKPVLMRLMVPMLSGKPGKSQLLQWLTVLRLSDLETTLGIMRRAEDGKPFRRPYGATRPFRTLEELMFLPAQLGRFPTPEDREVATRVVIGPAAQRPMEIAIPIMVAGMSYGLALTKAAKVAAARAAAEVGTATNSGENGFLEEERRAARWYVVQFNRGGWGNTPDQLARADMIEIQFGQGSDASAAESALWGNLTPEARQILRLKPGQDALIHSRFPDVNDEEDLKRLVARLRETAGGIPIAVKLCAGDIEVDLKAAVAAGVDVIVLDGAQGSTRSGYDITINDFGIPSLYAIPRAQRFLREKEVRDRVTLVAAGGLRTPGDFLKALALGADAVYIGMAAVLALVQTQAAKVVPSAPPSEMIFEGSDHVRLFNPEQGTRDLANFLRASAREMVVAARSLGRTSLGEVSHEDLVALTREAAEITGVRLAYEVSEGKPGVRRPEPLVTHKAGDGQSRGREAEPSGVH